MKARILSWAVLIISLVAIFSLSRSVHFLLKRGDLFVQKEGKLTELKKKNEELRKDLKKVQSEAFIEKEAREKLSMGKEEEVVVILPNNQTTKQPNNKEKELPNWKKWYNLFFY